VAGKKTFDRGKLGRGGLVPKAGQGDCGPAFLSNVLKSGPARLLRARVGREDAAAIAHRSRLQKTFRTTNAPGGGRFGFKQRGKKKKKKKAGPHPGARLGPKRGRPGQRGLPVKKFPPTGIPAASLLTEKPGGCLRALCHSRADGAEQGPSFP